MFIESLAMLTLFHSECTDKKIVIHSDKFMSDAKRVIDNEIEILQQDGKFILANPGPHRFGIGDKELCLFPPELTGESKWAAIIIDSEGNRSNHMFSTIFGLVEIMMQIFNAPDSPPPSNTEK